MDLDEAIAYRPWRRGAHSNRAQYAPTDPVDTDTAPARGRRAGRKGLTNKEIAARLFISERTAEGHIDQICNKLGFNSRVQIAAWLIRREHDSSA